MSHHLESYEVKLIYIAVSFLDCQFENIFNHCIARKGLQSLIVLINVAEKRQRKIGIPMT